MSVRSGIVPFSVLTRETQPHPHSWVALRLDKVFRFDAERLRHSSELTETDYTNNRLA